jgi:retron-type reverse transcriptase
MIKSQPLLEQLCSIKTLQTATDWLQSEHPQYKPDLGELAAKLQSGEYCFQPLTTVKTTNKLGEPETLEVWESQDRLVLKAMSLVLKAHLSEDFPTCCHHLEGRGGIKKAVRKTRDFVRDNPDSWVLKTDVKGYYAHIDHVVLYNQMQALIPNEDYLLRLTWQYLKRTVYDGGNYYDRELGISLGCPLSPLMAAVYLQPLDEAFEGKEWFYARFTDDWVIIVPTRWKLNFAVKKVNQILNQHKLTKADDKTFIGRSQRGFDFLGYHFTPESLTMGKMSLQRRDARLHQLYEQGADESRVGESVSRWQRAKTSDQLTEKEEFHHFPRQVDSRKLPLEAKFLALGAASVLSTAAFDSHAGVYQHGDTSTTAAFGTACSTGFSLPLSDKPDFEARVSVTSLFSSNFAFAYIDESLRIVGACGDARTRPFVSSSIGMTTTSVKVKNAASQTWQNFDPILLKVQLPNGLYGWARFNLDLSSGWDSDYVAANFVRYGVADEEPTLNNTAGLTNVATCPDLGNNLPTGAMILVLQMKIKRFLYQVLHTAMRTTIPSPQ